MKKTILALAALFLFSLAGCTMPPATPTDSFEMKRLTGREQMILTDISGFGGNIVYIPFAVNIKTPIKTLTYSVDTYEYGEKKSNIVELPMLMDEPSAYSCRSTLIGESILSNESRWQIKVSSGIEETASGVMDGPDLKLDPELGGGVATTTPEYIEPLEIGKPQALAVFCYQTEPNASVPGGFDLQEFEYFIKDVPTSVVFSVTAMA